jgi:allantoinase
VAAAIEARARGTDISIETCPHYLFFTEEDMERIGAAAKCAPPLRAAADRDELWRRLLAGDVDIVASDHSPSSPDLKQDDDFFRIWGGVAGVQSTLAVLLESGHHTRGMSLADIVRLTATKPATRFRIGGKGKIEPGFDADLVLVDLAESFTLAPEDLHQRHALSPYTGAQFRGRVLRTILRGKTIFQGGRITAEQPGQWVRPGKQETACKA